MLITQPNKFYFAACFFVWLSCEHLQHVCCQIDESYFLNLQAFFSICSALSSLGHRIQVSNVSLNAILCDLYSHTESNNR